MGNQNTKGKSAGETNGAAATTSDKVEDSMRTVIRDIKRIKKAKSVLTDLNIKGMEPVIVALDKEIQTRKQIAAQMLAKELDNA